MELDVLIISRVRIKVLTLFFIDSPTMLHVREIVRRVDEEINAVRRELSHLESAGILGKEQRANRLFYFRRKDYPLGDEVLRLLGKTTGIGADILKHRAKLGKTKFAILSMRYLKRLPKKSQTDVDLIIVGSIVLPELANIVKAEETRRSIEINYTVMAEEEFIFRRSRRDPFVMAMISSSRLMLLGDEEEFIG